jgi:hypothetical protein
MSHTGHDLGSAPEPMRHLPAIDRHRLRLATPEQDF